jgi:hypothetical protein
MSEHLLGLLVACTTIASLATVASSLRLRTSPWCEEGHRSTRWVLSFAFAPVFTYDRGYIWLRGYHRWQCSSGWGFWDDFPYSERGHYAHQTFS